jgi:hypothetical protein
MKTFTTWIQEGYYSPDDLAGMLLRASGSYLEAKKALTRASNDKKLLAAMSPGPGLKPLASGVDGTSDAAIYWAAYSLFQKGKKRTKRCSDHTALKRLLGGSYRGPWDRLKASGQTPQQVARLVQKPPKKS